MEDSIINIDAESDAFSLSSDTDIRNIVDQWKRCDAPTDLKYVDTRTFTRPRKKLYSTDSFTSSDNTISEHRDKASNDELMTVLVRQLPKINLKIGGLVTSMQRSLLGDVSPPLLMDNSIGNSLITSNDFSNIDFMNDTGESLSMANFNQYRLSDAINDRNFLERLTNYDESLFTKDADINNIDLIENGNCTGSSSSTLQNSTDSTSNLNKHDGTFVAPATGVMNGTFDASGEVDRTFIQAPDANISNNSKNGTFELGKNNHTFESKPIGNKLGITMPLITAEDDDLFLCESLSVTKNIEGMKLDEILDTSNVLLNCGSPHHDMNSTFQLDEYQSTPSVQKRKSRRSETISAISPIWSDGSKVSKNITQNVDKFVDIEIEDVPVYLRESVPKGLTRASNPTGIDRDLIEKERLSLSKFEEFENSLRILDDNKTEEEFDDLLNSFSSNIRNPLSQKVRQSLDNIKKRHSLIGMEKQQQDELNREKILGTPKSSRIAESDEIGHSEVLRRSPLISSTSSTGSGERLLRRSRLFDDAINTSMERLDNGDSDSGYTDNKQANELNSTQTFSKRNHLQTGNEYPSKTDAIYNTEESNMESKSNNRDRFKTIRIFKKPPENAIQIPNPDENELHSSFPRARPVEVFATKNTNSPQQTDQTKAINTMTFKRSGLARPRHLSGLTKRDLYAKSNSHEILSSDDPIEAIQPKPVSQLKSPMGIKSKSIHNLSMTKTKASGECSELEQPSANRNQLSSHTFKLPAQRSLANMRQRSDAGQPRKLSLIRPSSGYYGYNTKRTDSDTDLGRFSSNNSLSSGSSKSSLSRGETPESTAVYENPNTTFVQPPAPVKAATVTSRSAANGGSGIVPPRASMLRPPK